MISVDLSSSLRIPRQLELLTAASRLQDPADVVQLFFGALRQLYGARRYVLLCTHGRTPGRYAIGFDIDEQGVNSVRSKDPWIGQHLPEHAEQILADILATSHPRLLHQLTIDERSPSLFDGYGSVMIVPVFEEGVPRNWLIVMHRAPSGFGVADLEELNLRVNLVGALINNMHMGRRLRQAHDLIQHEVDRIAMIQRHLLPQQLPHIANASLAVSYETFDRAGGDLYDIRPVGPDAPLDATQPWSLLIADASGHGPAAAVMAAMFDAIIGTFPTYPLGPAEVLSHVNNHLCRKRIGTSFVTAFLAFYDPAEHSLTYTSAGHNPPLLKSAHGEAVSLDEAGHLPLGIDPGEVYQQHTMLLAPQQTLLLYTDGVSEAFNPRGELLGMSRLKRLTEACHGDPQCLIDTLLQAVREHEGGAKPHDDRTLLALQVSG